MALFSVRQEAAAGRALSFGEWTALFAACRDDPSISGARDAAILALFRVGGLRRSELANLQVSAYNSITQTLTIRGKRNCIRVVPIEDQGALDAGSDLSTVQKLMGHSDANTTAGYDRRGEHAQRSAVRKIHVPYRSRRNTEACED